MFMFDKSVKSQNSELINNKRIVNVWEYPEDKDTSSKWDDFSNIDGRKKQLTLGDQHGNFLKLLHSLIQRDVIDTSTKKDYRDLLELDKEHMILCQRRRKGRVKAREFETQCNNQIAKFDAIIDKLIVKQSDILIRLIGDVLADRGSNDYFTLALIAKLKEKGLKFEVLLSNHDDYFLRNYINPDNQQIRSHNNLNLIQNIIPPNKLRALKADYIGTIKLFSYSIETKDNKITELTIFNHAVAGPDCLKALIQKYSGEPHHIFDGICYADGSAIEICSTIDAVNKKFNAFLCQPDGLEKYQAIIQAEENHPWDEKTERGPVEKAPLRFLMWNRFVGEGDKWPIIENVVIRTGHGHVGQENQYQKEQGFNLDGDAGKFRGDLDGYIPMSLRNPMLCASSYVAVQDLPMNIRNMRIPKKVEISEEQKQIIKLQSQLYAMIADMRMSVKENENYSLHEETTLMSLLEQLHTDVKKIQDISAVRNICDQMEKQLSSSTLQHNAAWQHDSRAFSDALTKINNFFHWKPMEGSHIHNDDLEKLQEDIHQQFQKTNETFVSIPNDNPFHTTYNGNTKKIDDDIPDDMPHV